VCFGLWGFGKISIKVKIIGDLFGYVTNNNENSSFGSIVIQWSFNREFISASIDNSVVLRLLIQ